MTVHDEARGSAVSRRTMLRGATVGGVAVPFLAACGGGDETSSPDASAEPDATESSDPTSSDSSTPKSGGGGGTTVPTSDVPVGGGKILKDAKVVVTQPSDGKFMAFTAICTHQGCTVTGVEDGEIVCPCHGSRFSIEDGSNVGGPNGTEAGSVADLASKKVSVEGDQISVT